MSRTDASASPAVLDRHLKVSKYGDFVLTPAVRPSLSLEVVPTQGYRLEDYADEKSGLEIPMLAAAVSREALFEVFLDVVGKLADEVDVVIESHHQTNSRQVGGRCFIRERIESAIFASYCHDYVDLLLADGCFGIAVVDPKGPTEVQFDDHKVLVIYSKEMWKFERLMKQHGIDRNDDLRLICEGEHMHSTRPAFADRFEEFRLCLGAE